MPRVSTGGQSSRVSKLCIAMTLSGLAVVILLALFVFSLTGPTRSRDEKTVETEQLNYDDSELQRQNPTDDKKALRTILIIFTVTVVSLVAIICTITCLFLRKKRKDREQKAKLNTGIRNGERQRTRESTVQEDSEEDDDDNTCRKEQISKISKERLAKFNKLTHLNECDENTQIKPLLRSPNISQTFKKENFHSRAIDTHCKWKHCGFESTDNGGNGNEAVNYMKSTKDKCNVVSKGTDSVTAYDNLNNTIHEDKLENPDIISRNKVHINFSTEMPVIIEREIVKFNEPKVESVCHVKSSGQNPSENYNCTELQLVSETEVVKVEKEIQQATETLPEQEDETGICNEFPANGMEQEDDGFHDRLNWDQVFTFLVGILPPENYTIFFIELYGSEHDMQGLSIQNVISQVDKDVKDLETQSRLLRQFQKWKQLLGLRAKIKHIKTALVQMNYKEALHSFERFMREPPLFPEQASIRTQSATIEPLNRSNSNEKHCEYIKSQSLHTKFDAFGPYQKTITQTIVCNERNTQSTTMSFSGSRLKTGQRKRQRFETESSSELETDCKPSKNRRLNKRPQRIPKKRTRKQHPNKCDRLVQMEIINHSFIIELIKKLLLNGNILDKVSYHLFMRHTVQLIMKNTKKSEEEVLSVECEDISKCEKKVSSRGHIAYIIDFEHGYLMLNKHVWECLKLYNGQREKVCERLLSENSDYSISKYAFLNYGGQPLKDQAEKENMKDDDLDQTDVTSETTETSSEQSDDVFEKFLSAAEKNNNSLSVDSSRLTESVEKIEKQETDASVKQYDIIKTNDEDATDITNSKVFEQKIMDIPLD